MYVALFITLLRHDMCELEMEKTGESFLGKVEDYLTVHKVVQINKNLSVISFLRGDGIRLDVEVSAQYRCSSVVH